METCEKCGVTFQRPAQVVEVTSLRVLCPSCEAARKAAKAAAARPSAPPVPARQPVAAANAPSPKPAPAVQPPQPTASSKPKAPAAAPAKPTARPPAKKKIDLDSLESHALKKSESRSVLIGFGIALVVLGVGAVAVWKVVGIKRAETQAEDARLAAREKFRLDYSSIDITTEAGAQRLIEFVDLPESERIWREADFAPDVVGRRAKAKTMLESLQERRGLLERFQAIETALAQPESLAPVDMAEQRRRLEELMPKADFMGKDVAQRMTALREKADRDYVVRLKSEAEAAAGAAELTRAELARIQSSEDEILKLYEATYRAWDKNKQDTALAEKKQYYEDFYRQLISLSDQAVARFFTPEVIEATPWTDLLAGDQASAWAGEALKGFERRIENGVLHMIGPDPSVGSEGIISIGDREQWRDFVLDLEFTLLKGKVTLFLRLPRSWQENVESFELSSEEGYYEIGESYALWIRLIGSQLANEIRSADSTGPETANVSWTRVRKGAVGISIPKNSEIKITRLRIKVLR